MDSRGMRAGGRHTPSAPLGAVCLGQAPGHKLPVCYGTQSSARGTEGSGSHSSGLRLPLAPDGTCVNQQGLITAMGRAEEGGETTLQPAGFPAVGSGGLPGRPGRGPSAHFTSASSSRTGSSAVEFSKASSDRCFNSRRSTRDRPRKGSLPPPAGRGAAGRGGSWAAGSHLESALGWLSRSQSWLLRTCVDLQLWPTCWASAWPKRRTKWAGVGWCPCPHSCLSVAAWARPESHLLLGATGP